MFSTYSPSTTTGVPGPVGMGVGVGQNMVEVKVEGQLSLIVVAIVREVSVTQHNYEIIHTGKKVYTIVNLITQTYRFKYANQWVILTK